MAGEKLGSPGPLFDEENYPPHQPDPPKSYRRNPPDLLDFSPGATVRRGGGKIIESDPLKSEHLNQPDHLDFFPRATV